MIACDPVPGLVDNASDCDDANDKVHPLGAEGSRADGLDQDCNAITDDLDPRSAKIAIARDADSTWLFVDGNGQWADAEASCASYGGYHLVSIDDDAENEALIAAQPYATSWWTGYLYDGAGWYWSDGNPSAYTDWLSGDPNFLPQEACVRLNGVSGLWQNEQCDRTYDWICEHDCVAVATYADHDGDGFGNPYDEQLHCLLPPGRVRNALDCDDRDPTDALRLWYADADGDGFGDPLRPEWACLQPPDTSTNGWDCDDADPEVGDGTIWYVDADGDGYGAEASAIACEDPNGTRIPGDCDDGDDTVYPGAPEASGDDIDSDCDGQRDPPATNAQTTPPGNDNPRSDGARAARLTDGVAPEFAGCRCSGWRAGSGTMGPWGVGAVGCGAVARRVVEAPAGVVAAARSRLWRIVARSPHRHPPLDRLRRRRSVQGGRPQGDGPIAPRVVELSPRGPGRGVPGHLAAAAGDRDGPLARRERRDQPEALGRPAHAPPRRPRAVRRVVRAPRRRRARPAVPARRRLRLRVDADPRRPHRRARAGRLGEDPGPRLPPGPRTPRARGPRGRVRGLPAPAGGGNRPRAHRDRGRLGGREPDAGDADRAARCGRSAPRRRRRHQPVGRSRLLGGELSDERRPRLRRRGALPARRRGTTWRASTPSGPISRRCSRICRACRRCSCRRAGWRR